MHILLAFLLLVSACSSSQIEDTRVIENSTADTAIAEIIHKQVGGKLVAIELVTPYPENYRATVDQVARENETGFLPPLKTKIDNIQQYDIVFVGFPTWGMQLPPPMKSFLRQNDLTGKTVIPFNTNAGYGIGSSFETVRPYVPTAQF